MFKFRNILSSIATILSFHNSQTRHQPFLSRGIPNKFHHSRFSGVSRAKRMARKLRNRRRSRA